jgi:photosystem II stability/assembly factor-like uncharacterized protein
VGSNLTDCLTVRTSVFTMVLIGAAMSGAVTSAIPPAAQAQSWQSLGPAPITNVQSSGRASALALSTTKKKRYWVAGASGGVWRSKSGGRRWKVQTDELPTLAIGALALDPSNEKVIYAGSGEANYAYHSLYGLGLYKSTDSGASWQVLAARRFSGRTFSRLVVSPANGNSVWAAVARAGGTRQGNEGARLHPKRNGKMGIFRSDDGGVTWKRVRNGLPKIPASDVDLDPTDPERLFASFGNVFGHRKNGIYRSSDGGASWSRLPLGPPGTSLGRISLAIAPSDPNRIYALVALPATSANTGGFAPGDARTRGLYRSDDGGDSWQRLDPGNPQSCCGQYYSAIAVHPTDPDRFVIGGLNLLASDDGGMTYSDVTPPHVDQHDAAFDAAGRLVVASDGGVHRTSDFGRNWVNLNKKLGTIQFYPGLAIHPTQPEVVMGGTQDNGTNLRLNPSNSWLNIFGGDGGWCLIRPDDPSVLFIEFQGTGNLLRSADGGQSFVVVDAGIAGADRTAFQAPVLFDPADSDHMFYATQRIYESTDGGFNWAPISGDLVGPPWAIRSLAVAPSDSEVLYAATSDGGLHASSDGGATWSRTRSGVGGWPRIMRQIAVDPQDARVAYVADMRFGGGKVLKTSDGGASWASLAGDLPDVPVSSVAVYRDGGTRYLLAGTDAGVFLSQDEGAAWTRYGNGLPNAPAMDLVVDAARGRLVVSTLGRGMWVVELPG